MEKDSTEISRLSQPNSTQESKPRRRWRKRDQNIVENTQPYKPKIKRYPIPDIAVPSISRGEKRRNAEDEDKGLNVKRLMTQHINQSDGDGLHHYKSSQSKQAIIVNHDPGCDGTDGTRELEKSTLLMNDSLLKRCEKRKPDIDQNSLDDIKRLKVSLNGEEFNVRDHHSSDKRIEHIPCKNSCVCKIGPSQKPRSIERRGSPTIAPLYKKLLQRRMLSTINVVMSECCDRQCCHIWSDRRYSNQHFDDGYDPSNLRVDHFSWGVWKQKPEIRNNNNNDDDWFW